jgi:5-methylcytosine-specific restriction enzyme B
MLDPQIKKKILDAYDGAKVDGNLYSRDKLDTFFRNFRSRFGPDELKQLEGRELLERMHGRGDNDSLAYWLEFKYDADEFPGTEFGGIGGGSAFKFGIFYRRGIDMWLASGPTPKGHEISVAEAIAVASKQRDQFLRGYELLEQLPVGADDAAYLKLQRQLEELAPDVGDSAWGHKYFYLMFPEKLDDFHSPIWQRFYLLKALQLPPPRDGRYVCAGRYVAMSREVDLPMHNFTCCLYDAVGPMHDYWRVEIVDPINRQNGWDMMRADKCIAVRWPELEDLSTVEPASLAQQAARFVTRVREGTSSWPVKRIEYSASVALTGRTPTNPPRNSGIGAPWNGCRWTPGCSQKRIGPSPSSRVFPSPPSTSSKSNGYSRTARRSRRTHPVPVSV